MDPQKITIIGGGLGGMITGLQLQHADPENKLDITVLEKAAEPYTTLCGEGLSEDTLNIFNPAFDSTPYIAQEFGGASWEFPGETTFYIHQKCYTMARKDWVPAMAKKFEEQGGTLKLNHRVSKEEIDALDADLIIGADGPSSVVRRSMPSVPQIRTCGGIQYRVVNSTYKTEWLEFFTDKQYTTEYAWIFPRGDMLNVGLLARGDGKDWVRLDQFMKDKNVGGEIHAKEAYPIGFGGVKVQEGKKILIGDAAGLTNPLTKGGMAALMYASDILVKCITENRIQDYQNDIMAHPIASPDFQTSLAFIKNASNEELARLLKLFPKEINVGPGISNAPFIPRVLATMLSNPSKAKILWSLYKSMKLSRKYSW